MNEAATRKAWHRPLLLGIAALAFAAGVFFGGMRLIENQPMPDTQLSRLTGEQVTLPAITAGRPSVVNLWATWCPPCRLELPYLAAAQKQDAGMNFVFVDQGEDAATIQRYLASAGLELGNVLLDQRGKLGRDLGASGLPVTLFYDEKGRMVDSHLGALSPSSLEEKLKRLRPIAKTAAN